VSARACRVERRVRSTEHVSGLLWCMRAHTGVAGRCLYCCTAATPFAWSPDADRALVNLRQIHTFADTLFHTRLGDFFVVVSVARDSPVRPRASMSWRHARIPIGRHLLPGGSGMASNEIIVLPARTKQSPTSHVRTTAIPPKLQRSR